MQTELRKPDLSKKQKQELTEFTWDVALKAAREDFYVFVQMMAPEFIPGGRYQHGAHIELICKELQEICFSVEKNEIQLNDANNDEMTNERLQMWVPPRSGKTMISSILFPIWCLGRNPHWYILAIGHGTDFAEKTFGGPALNLAQSDSFKRIFPNFQLDVKTAGKGTWKTKMGGTYSCAGVGSRIAGKGAHISICDDVIVDQTAMSKTEREKINEWYVPSLRTRIMPGGGEVMINARWHLDDLSGYMTELDESIGNPWRIIRIPAILDQEAADLLDLPVNGSYWPQRWSMKWLEQQKAANANKPHYWAALYMQDPIAEGGSYINVEDFSLWEENEFPVVDYVLVSIDAAASTKETADYTAIAVWGFFKKPKRLASGEEVWQNNMILLYAKRGRFHLPELFNICEVIRREYKPDLFLVENKSSGITLLQELRLRGIFCQAFTPRAGQDKITRAMSSAPMVKEGLVWIPEPNGPLAFDDLSDFVEECVRFPYAKNDDFVDTLTQSVLWSRDNFHLISEMHSRFDDDDEDDWPHKSGRSRSYWGQLS